MKKLAPFFTLLFVLLTAGCCAVVNARNTTGELSVLTIGTYTSNSAYELTGPYVSGWLPVVQTYRNTSSDLQDSLFFNVQVLGSGTAQSASKFFGKLKGLGAGAVDMFDVGDLQLPVPGAYIVRTTVFVHDRTTGTWGSGLSQDYRLVLTSKPLPVTLVSFTAQAVQDSVALVWLTSSEENCFGFWTEHSTDGISWLPGNFLPSQATHLFPGANHKYGMRERRLAQRTYYRLRQVDVGTGHQNYSPIQVVAGLGSSDAVAAVFPNPASSAATVLGGAGSTARLYDTRGRLSKQQLLDLSEKLDLHGVPSGTYLLIVNDKRTRLTVGN